MSSTNRGAQRSPADYYPSPAWPVRRFLERCGLPTGRWLEPSAGEGHIIRACAPLVSGVEWTAVELRPECAPLLSEAGARVLTGNFLAADPEWLGLGINEKFDVAIGNPPFSLAHEFVEHARRFAHVTVMLLRLGFLESEERADFLRSWMPNVYVIPERISYTGTGRTDSTAYAWFVWGDRWRSTWSELRVLSSTPLEERKAPTACVLPAPVIEQMELFTGGAA